MLISSLYSPASKAQSPRSLTVWIDTLHLNVCDDGKFGDRELGVWVGTLNVEPPIIGFTEEDDVDFITIKLVWDTGSINLTSPYIHSSAQTLAGRVPIHQATADTTEGWLYVEVGVTSLTQSIKGANIPLFYLNGRVKVEDTLGGLLGGIGVESVVDIQATTTFESLRYNPGFVRVVRDTTPEYSSVMRVSDGDFDTTQLDTVEVIVTNIGDRKIDRLEFSIEVDTTYFCIVDTLESSTTYSVGWTSRELLVSPDKLEGVVSVVGGYPQTNDSVFLRLLILRKTDSSFQSRAIIDEYKVNNTSCIGKIEKVDGAVVASVIHSEDTTITTSVLIRPSEQDRKKWVRILPMQSNGVIRVMSNSYYGNIDDVQLFDQTGKKLAVTNVSGLGSELVELQVSDKFPRGAYFAAIHSHHGIEYKQFVVIN